MTDWGSGTHILRTGEKGRRVEMAPLKLLPDSSQALFHFCSAKSVFYKTDMELKADIPYLFLDLVIL